MKSSENYRLQVGVKCLIVNPDKNQFLAMRRSSIYSLEFNESHDIPGGRLERGEEPLAGLEREMSEEIGIESICEPYPISVGNIVNRPDLQIIRITFAVIMDLDVEKLKISEEHELIEWMPLDEHPQYHSLLNESIKKVKESFG